MVYKKRSIYPISVFILLLVATLFANAVPANKDFFSCGRFFINTQIIDQVSSGEKMANEIKKFAGIFTDGVYLYSGEHFDKAKEKFFTARRIWPEYYGTDFMLALTFEGEGNIKTAARFYKSYLQKIRDFHAGKYKISAPIIRFISVGEIERYSSAEKMVKEHLLAYGIHLDKVRPAPSGMGLTVFFAVLAGLIALYFAITRAVMPYYRKKRRMKKVREGFWYCKHCGAISPDLSNVCTECLRGRSAQR